MDVTLSFGILINDAMMQKQWISLLKDEKAQARSYHYQQFAKKRSGKQKQKTYAAHDWLLKSTLPDMVRQKNDVTHY